MFFKKLLILLTVTFWGYTGKSQNGSFQLYQNGYYIKQYSELAGLADNRCKYLFEDSKGFLWISTFQGLSRFDGVHFVNYGLKEGLPSVNISQVVEDSAGFIYVATAKGIARYTGQQSNSDNCFYVYKQTTGLPSAISGMQVIDSSTIVFQRIGSGLYLLQKNKLSQVGNEILNYELSIFKDRYNNIYSYTNDTFRIYNKGLVLINKVAFPAAYYMTFYYDNIDKIFHAYSNGKSYQLNSTGLSYTGPAPDSIVWFWKDNSANKIYYSKERTGLYVNDRIASTPIVNLGSLSLYSNDLRQTKDKSVWVTTNAGGILKISPLPYREIKTPNGICFETINNRSVIQIDNPLLPTIAATTKQLKNCIVRSAFISRDKTIWYCASNGIYKQEPGKSVIHYPFSGNEALYGPVSTEVKNVAECPNGDLWFYGYSGVIRYSKGQFKQFTTRNGLSNDILVRQLAVEKSGTVLLADWYNLFVAQNDTLIKIDKEIGLANYIPNKIVADNSGAIWIDHNKKIFKLEKTKEGNFKITDSIAPSFIIPSTEITSFEFDGYNNCWVGYSGGKIRVFFLGKDGRYNYDRSIAYTIEDGLAPATGIDYYFYQNADGNMAVVTKKNTTENVFIFSIISAFEKMQMIAPQVCLTNILIMQDVPDWQAMGYATGPDGLPHFPKLSFNKNDITFNYSAVSLKGQDGMIYQVMLQGYDKEWHTTTQTTASYTNLPPDDYCFLVKAANANGSWSNTFQYYFTILKPWYKTWWALSLWSILIIATALIIFHFWLKAVRKEDSLANLKKSNEFKTMLIALLGHDIIIPLQYIGKVAAQLKTYNEKLSKETLTESLGDINITASQLQLFGESIVHWIKIQNSEEAPFLNKEFIIDDLLTELLTFHTALSAQKNNTIIKEVDPDLLFIQDPFLIKTILHNLLVNANKFTANGTITIKAITQNDTLILTVTDTGKGMPQEKVDELNNFRPVDSNPGTHKEQGWGLGYIIIMDLLKFSKGKLQVQSQLDKGTTITVELPSG